MNKSASPYRRSIWKPRPAYRVNYAVLTRDQLRTITRLGWVDAAKKRAPPIAAKSLLKIARAAGLKARGKISQEDFDCLVGKDVRKFADVYVGKVIAAWRQSRQNRSPEKADLYWARSGRLAKNS